MKGEAFNKVLEHVKANNHIVHTTAYWGKELGVNPGTIAMYIRKEKSKDLIEIERGSYVAPTFKWDWYSPRDNKHLTMTKQVLYSIKKLGRSSKAELVEVLAPAMPFSKNPRAARVRNLIKYHETKGNIIKNSDDTYSVNKDKIKF